MAMDDFGNIVRQAMEKQPLAWLFFIPFSVVRNLRGAQPFHRRDRREHPDAARGAVSADAAAAQAASDAAASAAHADQVMLLHEIRALRAEVAALRAERAGG